MKSDVNLEFVSNDSDEINLKTTKLVRKKLKESIDWSNWNKAEYLQLDQYEIQQTFGTPCTLPLDANVLDLRWAYM